jgi:hypothetical protein
VVVVVVACLKLQHVEMDCETSADQSPGHMNALSYSPTPDPPLSCTQRRVQSSVQRYAKLDTVSNMAMVSYDAWPSARGPGSCESLDDATAR